MRILQICHGYPPRENAGTERHTEQLVGALMQRGHAVEVISATRAPGRLQYSVQEEPGVTRIVNNLVSRSLAQGEHDRAIETQVEKVVARFNPDLVHIQHLQYLSSGLRFSRPTILTLHDQWLWCASGGIGVEENQICYG